MGQSGSSSSFPSVSDTKPKRVVPTSTQLRRAKLESEWWALQADGRAPAPLCLQAYGGAYAALLERSCGQHQREHNRCLRAKKLDPLNMAAWYPLCGEPFELESACAVGLLGEVDQRCRAPLDRAAKAVLSAQGRQDDPGLRTALEAVGQCVAQVGRSKGFSVEYDAVAARQRFEASKRLMVR
mmetsp:Transcript_46796/g.106123  ORF Transcript_46796/g.106123 Transcript_46796/m.106123 type:complete len:183 (-) Transcript_46796:16-564(-)